MGFMLGDPFSHYGVKKLAESLSLRKQFKTESLSGRPFYACYRWTITNQDAIDAINEGWRIPVQSGDVAVLSIWGDPAAPQGAFVLQRFIRQNDDDSWSAVPDTFNSLQPQSVGAATWDEVITQIDALEETFSDAYGRSSFASSYNECFGISWRREHQPVWSSDSIPCQSCGASEFEPRILIYQWSLGDQVEYRSTNSCQGMKNLELTGTDLASLTAEILAEIATWDQDCDTDDGDNGGDEDDDDEDEDTLIYGCMDDTASNYDATATFDDGSCEYTEDESKWMIYGLLALGAIAFLS